MDKCSNHSTANKPLLGISACLTGAAVRHNGGHKQSRYCTQILSRYVDFKPICPEVAIGLSTPRPAIRLVEAGGQVKVLQTHHPEQDYAPLLNQYAQQVAPALQDLSGFIFMQKSPTCGLGSTTLYTEKGFPKSSGNGVFAERLTQLLPNLPVTEAGRLNDSRCRENFMLQVYAYFQWQSEVLPNLSMATIQAFHHRYKLPLRAHSEVVCKQLGQLLADPNPTDLTLVAQRYIGDFMQAMKKLPNHHHYADLLMRIYKILRHDLDGSEKQQSMQIIEHYRQGIVPLIVPMTMLKFFTQKYQVRSDSAVWDAYPFELGLQNAI
ncbi:YbgA family protein [Neptunicella sp. SCSIO 80796]|uniref:YbgA family protein n=1 Tax=Neptunicella plasticusilytica TaxID=3117012 RepID=UPI003A4D9831